MHLPHSLLHLLRSSRVVGPLSLPSLPQHSPYHLEISVLARLVLGSPFQAEFPTRAICQIDLNSVGSGISPSIHSVGKFLCPRRRPRRLLCNLELLQPEPTPLSGDTLRDTRPTLPATSILRLLLIHLYDAGASFHHDHRVAVFCSVARSTISTGKQRF